MYSIQTLSVNAIAVILAMSIHELAHGLVSYWMGDPTAKMEGRLTLNPLHHIDWVGLLCLLVCGFGWAKPVPIDSRYYKDQKTGIIWTSFAGPFANFLLSLLCVFLYYALYKFAPSVMISNVGAYLALVFQYIAIISTGFGIFNLIPIPPLDGSKIIFSFLPDEKYYRFISGNQWMQLVLIALLLTGVLNTPLMMVRTNMIQFYEVIVRAILGF